MYLVELDSDGLVKVTGAYDGVRAIKEFREILDDEALGVQCLTAIALTADWLTPIRHYTIEDRSKKAMYMITGNRKAFVWNQERIQSALMKYQELQYNPALVEKTTLDKMLIDQLQLIENEKDADQKITLFGQLATIKDLIRGWIKQNEAENPLSNGPVENGYTLTRLEEKLKDKSSFYNV